MSAGPEVVDEWIATTLLGDAQITALVGDRVYSWTASKDMPALAEPPLIVFQNQSLRDIRGVGTIRVMTSCLYLVRAIVQGFSFAPATPISKRIDELLHGKQDQVTPDGTVVAAVREEPYQMVDVDSGIQYRHRGGIYRIWATNP